MINIQRLEIRTATFVWLLLLAFTLATYLIATYVPFGPAIVGTVLGITFFKGRLVICHFMGVRYCRPVWRVIMMAYLLVVGSVITLAYLAAPVINH
jgi:hypothetical protein